MEIPTQIRQETIRELGDILADFTYGIYQVKTRRVWRTSRCNRLCKMAPCRAHGKGDCAPSCPRPTCSTHGRRQVQTYAITSLMIDSTTRVRKDMIDGDPVLKSFTGENAALDATSFLIGLLSGKRELSKGRAQRVRFIDEELRQKLRRNSRHYADYAHYVAEGRNQMLV